MADPQLSAATADSECEAPSPQIATSLETPSMKCCCGSAECVYLRHNYAILNNVEKDVHQAARMGQALLARHESYMANAERDRAELNARIEQLENENKDLQLRNAKMVEENRDLLAQLESLNTTIFDSEVHMKSLEATLLSSQQTIRRLETETARAEALEQQIASLEQEQAEIQGTLLLSREEARSATSRWKRAERSINDLQKQLERIEKEAKKEREHHMEMMGRLEKQREMEKELNTAAGRLKGAAAAKFMAQGNAQGPVVGTFVRDLLKDNANLQFGIAELREMLMSSNNEIQSLRDQLDFHQPMGDIEASGSPTLRAELETKQRRSSQSVSQAVHIHHHYHVAPHRQDARKSKKKRPGLTVGVFSPPSGADPSTPLAAARHSAASRSRKNSVLSNRWSMYSEQPSEFALSSDPSSPRSNRRNSVFDLPPSFPGSPSSSIDPISPEWKPPHKRMSSNVSARSFHAPTYFPFGAPPANIAHPIAEESSDGAEMPAIFSPMTSHSIADDEDSSPGLGVFQDSSSSSGPEEITIMRSQSVGGRVVGRGGGGGMHHKSLSSLSGGLYIPTLKSRPNQITIRPLGSASSVTGSSIVIARPLLLRDSVRRSSVLLRDSFAASPTPVGSFNADHTNASPPRPSSESSKLGKWVGWRPWGVLSSSSGGPSRTKAKAKVVTPRKRANRSPGINQSGAVPGFSEFLAAAAAAKKKPPTTTAGEIAAPIVMDHEEGEGEEEEVLSEGLGV